MEFLLLTRFYLLRAYRAQAFFAWTIIALTACIATAAGVLVISFQQVQVQENELTELRQKNRVHAPAATGGRTAATEASNELPPFASGSFAEQFNSLAADAGVPIEELSYVLESEARQPYLRYRLTTAVKTGYPQIRKLVAVLANELPNVMLDAIRCTKENAMAEQLACELVFSAVFRKGSHGG